MEPKVTVVIPTLDRVAKALDAHSGAAAAFGARTRFRDGVVGGRIAHPLHEVVGDLGPELHLSWGWIPSQALCRAATVRLVGGWREDVPHAEDLDMWARIGWRGPVVLEPETVLEYRVHRTQSRLQDPAALRDLLLAPHQTDLAGGNGARGRTLRQAGRWWDRANVAFARGEYRRSLGMTLRASLLAPRLLTSPAVGPVASRMIVRSAVRCFGPTRRWVESRPAPAPGERPRRGTGFLA
jgi:hypothetical protein